MSLILLSFTSIFISIRIHHDVTYVVTSELFVRTLGFHHPMHTAETIRDKSYISFKMSFFIF